MNRIELEREAKRIMSECDKDELIRLYIEDMSDDDLDKWVYYNKFEDE